MNGETNTVYCHLLWPQLEKGQNVFLSSTLFSSWKKTLSSLSKVLERSFVLDGKKMLAVFFCFCFLWTFDQQLKKDSPPGVDRALQFPRLVCGCVQDWIGDVGQSGHVEAVAPPRRPFGQLVQEGDELWPNLLACVQVKRSLTFFTCNMIQLKKHTQCPKVWTLFETQNDNEIINSQTGESNSKRNLRLGFVTFVKK